MHDSMRGIFPRRKKRMSTVLKFDRLEDTEHNDELRKVYGRLVDVKADKVEAGKESVSISWRFR